MTMSEQRKDYLYSYQKEKLKRIPLDVPKEKYEEIKAAADAAGEKVNGYIKKAIDERMERDKNNNLPHGSGSIPPPDIDDDDSLPEFMRADYSASQKEHNPQPAKESSFIIKNGRKFYTYD